MIISDKDEDIQALAERCPAAALVLTDEASSRIHFVFLNLGTDPAESSKARAAGFTQLAGAVGITEKGEIQSVAKVGFIFQCILVRAAVLFREEIVKCRTKFAEETMAKLNPRMGHA